MAHLESGHQMKSTALAVASQIHHSNHLSHDADEAELARFGKKQQLKIAPIPFAFDGWAFMYAYDYLGSYFGVSLHQNRGTTTEKQVLNTHPRSFDIGLQNGGPAGLVYGFLFAWAGSTLQALVQGEMGSMIPVAGGYYNWVAVLAPPWCSKFLSYLTGWIAVIGYQANISSVAFAASLMTQGLMKLNNPDYDIQPWQGTLLFWALLLICLVINTWLARLLPHIEVMVLLLHVVGFFCILIPLVYLAPHKSPAEVFLAFNNDGEWPSTGMAFFVGLSTVMYPFVGSDAAAHMAEEIEGASVVIPRSMVVSVTLNGVLGLAILIAALFCLGDVQAALNTPTGFSFMEVFVNATQSIGASTALASIVIAAFASASVGYLATASRMTWAFAREQGLPGSGFLSRVEPRTLLPMYSIALSFTISLLLSLINIGSAAAFQALFSVVISAYYAAFTFSAAVLLHKRLTTPKHKMDYGPFRLGRAGIPIIILSIIYSVIGIFFSFFPSDAHFNIVDMNWSIVVSGGMFIFSIIFWFISGRKHYKGPVLEL